MFHPAFSPLIIVIIIQHSAADDKPHNGAFDRDVCFSVRVPIPRGCPPYLPYFPIRPALMTYLSSAPVSTVWVQISDEYIATSANVNGEL